jgi:hypothetical protein
MYAYQTSKVSLCKFFFFKEKQNGQTEGVLTPIASNVWTHA